MNLFTFVRLFDCVCAILPRISRARLNRSLGVKFENDLISIILTISDLFHFDDASSFFIRAQIMLNTDV